MALLNARNSGDASNCAAVIQGYSTSGAAAALSCRSTMRHLPAFPNQLLVGQSPSDNVPHHIDEPFDVVHVPVIVPESVFVNVTEQTKGSTATYVPVRLRFKRLQKFSRLFA